MEIFIIKSREPVLAIHANNRVMSNVIRVGRGA